MADAQKVVELIFQGIDKTGAATQAALGNIQGFSDNIERAAQPLADITLAMFKLEAGLITAGAAVSLFSVKVAGDFDGAFREIATLIDVPIEALGEFRQAILDYAAGSTQPLEEVTQAIYNAISLGLDYTQSIEAIAQAEKLAVAGKAGLNESLKVLLQSLNAYGLGMYDAERFSDALFQTVRDGATTIPELAASLGAVTTAASTLEIPFETILAAVATLTAGGASTSEAVTRINAALTALIKPSSEAAAEAKRLEIQFDAQAVKAKGLEVVLDDVARATGGNERSMSLLFGSVEAVKAIFPLTGAAADKFADSLDNQANKAGVTATAFEKMVESIDLSNQQVKNSLEQVFIAIGDRLLDEYGGIAAAIAKIFEAIGLSVKDGGLSDLVGIVEGIFADVQGTLEQIAKNLPAALNAADFSSFEKGLKVVVDAIKNLFDGIDLTTVEGLTKAIEFVGTAFLSLQQYVAGAINALKPMFELFVSLAQAVAKIDPEMFKLIGTLGGVAVAVTTLLPAVNTLLLGFVALQGATGAAGAATALGALGSALGTAGLAAAAGAAGYAVGTLLNEPINALVSKLAGSQTTLGSWIYDLINGKKEAELFGQSIATAGDGTAQFTAATAQAVASLDGIAGAVSKVTNGPFVEYLDAQGNIIERTLESGQSLDEWNTQLLSSGGVLKESTVGLDQYGNAINAASLLINSATGAVTGYRGAWEDLTAEQQLAVLTGKQVSDQAGQTAGSLSAISEETKKAEEATRKWNEEMAKMQHAERLELIKSQTAITTAQIEADAQKMVAAFESVSTAITSTGETLTSLYGTLNGNDLSRLQELDLEQTIRNEEDRRQEAFEQQKKLTDAMIKEIQARTEAMQRGDAMIQIDGAGLQPHLEAFMWEILRAIQVRVNQDGYEMLLGA